MRWFVCSVFSHMLDCLHARFTAPIKVHMKCFRRRSRLSWPIGLLLLPTTAFSYVDLVNVFNLTRQVTKYCNVLGGV